MLGVKCWWKSDPSWSDSHVVKLTGKAEELTKLYETLLVQTAPWRQYIKCLPEVTQQNYIIVVWFSVKQTTIQLEYKNFQVFILLYIVLHTIWETYDIVDIFITHCFYFYFNKICKILPAEVCLWFFLIYREQRFINLWYLKE